MQNISRRDFIRSTSAVTATLVSGGFSSVMASPGNKILVGAHLWVYASKYPPHWDCMPIIDQVFSDLKYAGIEGLEVMDVNLYHDNAVEKLGGLMVEHNLPIIGSSYSGDMWNKDKHQQIENECGILFEKLNLLKAKTFGITVGDARHKKTEAELDAQADILKKIRVMGEKKGIASNLHNHTYEIVNEMYDLNGTLKRIPDFPLGPDLNWLLRGGVDPVKFIEQFKNQIIYLHIRDQYKNGEWSEALGEGDTDFSAISRAIHKVKFSGIATIELAFPSNFTPTRPLKDSWKISRNFVKKNFGW